MRPALPHVTVHLQFWFLMLSALALVACKNKSAVGDSTPESAALPSPDTVAVAQTPELPKDTLILSFERTACFGKCPAFKVHIYESGYATWHGVNFVERMGHFESRLDANEIDALLTEAVRVGFFDFDPVYDFASIQDLPAAMLYMRQGEQEHMVRARFEVPKKVQQFISWIDQRLESFRWQSTE